MSRFRCYIQPFDSQGNYTGTWTDVSDDVDFEAIGKITRQVDANPYDVGVFKFSQVAVTFFNATGKYSGPGVVQSIFRFRVADSQIKITWDANDYYCRAGMCTAGAIKLFKEVEVFRGLLNDVAGAIAVDSQKVSYQVLGQEAKFDRTVNPGGFLNADTYSQLIYKALNQTDITTIMTVDPGNISVGVDYTVDDVTKYDGKTVKEILDNLLFLSNSVLYVNNGIIYVVPRSHSGASKATFYGQASNSGIEDIINIQNFNTGARKMFNYWTWSGATPIVLDAASIKQNGLQKNEISGIDEINTTSTTLITNILTALNTQFSSPKQEFEFATPIRAKSIGIYLMDHVTVDYPTVFSPADSNPLPLYGVAVYGTARYPLGQWQITIPTTDDYQIIGWGVDIKNQNFLFTVKKFN